MPSVVASNHGVEVVLHNRPAYNLAKPFKTVGQLSCQTLLTV